jgi:hypothetical protein
MSTDTLETTLARQVGDGSTPPSVAHDGSAIVDSCYRFGGFGSR